MKDFILYHFCLLGPPSTLPFIWTFNPVIFLEQRGGRASLRKRGSCLECSDFVVRHMIIEPLAPLRKGSCLNHLGELFNLYIPLLSSWFSSLWGMFSSVLTEPLKEICYNLPVYSVQFRSVTQLCPTLWDPLDCSMPGFPVHHELLELTQTHVHWLGDAIQPSHPLSSPFPPAFNHSQHQGLFKWVSSSHQVAKVLEFQLQHQSFQWIFRTNFL